jgi:signal transduction histidine kinase
MNPEPDTISIIRDIYRSAHSIDLKHELACRLLARHLDANSVSILLYDSPNGTLNCRGRFIDPRRNRANARATTAASRSIVKVMHSIDAIEFRLMRRRTLDPEDYPAYRSNPCLSQMLQTKGGFTAFTAAQGVHLRSYMRYKRCIAVENHKVGLSESISGLYYYLLHHPENAKRANKEYRKYILSGGGKIDPQSKICICNLYNKPSSIKLCRTNLRDQLGIDVEDGGIYVGVPLMDSTNRLIGVLRVIIGLSSASKLLTRRLTAKQLGSNQGHGTYVCGGILDHVVSKRDILAIAALIGEKLGNEDLLQGYRNLNLRDKLDFGGANYHGLADELTKVVNCFGCIIRMTDSRKQASMVGWSSKVEGYVKEIVAKGDPYVVEGTFHPALLQLFYGQPGNAKMPSPGQVISALIKVTPDQPCQATYQYVTKQNLIASRALNSPVKPDDRNSIQHLFDSFLGSLGNFDITEILIVPIRGVEFGFVAFANRSVHPFRLADIEMIIPVVRRMGDEHATRAKHQQEKEDALINSTRIMFHQLGSPITSLRDHVYNLAHNNIVREDLPKRLEEMEFTYQDYLDKLGMNQFFFDYALHNEVKLNLEQFNVRKFVLDRIRTYQLRAKEERGVNIKLYEELSRYSLYTDEKLFGHVVQSLLDNAIKYSYDEEQRSEAGRRHAPNEIQVELENSESGFTLRVKNWGCPIEDNELEHIFTLEKSKFARLGSGIGLHVARTIVVDILKGQLSVAHDKRSARTTFTVKLNPRP